MSIDTFVTRFIVTLIYIAVLLTLFPDDALACSCGWSEPKEALDRSDAVFYGTVLEIKTVPKDVLNDLGLSTARFPRDTMALLKVHKTWKGKLGYETAVLGGGGGYACGFTFLQGVKYIVYASATGKNNEFLATSRCSRTRTTMYAREDVEFLGGLDLSQDLMNGDLLTAIWEGKTKKAIELHKSGAKLDAVGRYSALTKAIRAKNDALIDYFLAHKANPNQGGYYGNSPFIWAVEVSPLSVIKKLEAAGADIKHRNLKNATALHYAAARGKVDVVEYLLSKGANPNAEAVDGTTPIVVARDFEKHKIVAMLEKAGGKISKAYHSVRVCYELQETLFQVAEAQYKYFRKKNEYTNDLSSLKKFEDTPTMKGAKITIVSVDKKGFTVRGRHPECVDNVGKLRDVNYRYDAPYPMQSDQQRPIHKSFWGKDW